MKKSLFLIAAVSIFAFSALVPDSMALFGRKPRIPDNINLPDNPVDLPDNPVPDSPPGLRDALDLPDDLTPTPSEEPISDRPSLGDENSASITFEFMSNLA